MTATYETAEKEANDVKQILSSDELLPRHSGLQFGTLPNGLRYCIFPNKKPSGRFYANLEVHAGSVDELEHERGLAHYLEHVLFLGTEKYRTSKAMKKLFAKLGMGFNADANAYTDFRSTVYTLSAPTKGDAKTIEARPQLSAPQARHPR
jgi:zinc protease